MATTVRRKKAEEFDPNTAFTQHLVLKLESALVVKRSEALKTKLKEFLTKGSDKIYVNEHGSKFYDLPESFTFMGKTFKGMELRRSAPVTFNEETAVKILKKKGVYEEALSTYVDQEKVHRLLAEEKITEADLDKMFDEDEKWAFWPVEGEVED